MLQIELKATYFYRTQVYLGSDLWVCLSLTDTPFADLTDVTLADEPRQCGNANYTIWLPTLELMQVTSPDYQEIRTEGEVRRVHAHL